MSYDNKNILYKLYKLNNKIYNKYMIIKHWCTIFEKLYIFLNTKLYQLYSCIFKLMRIIIENK